MISVFSVVYHGQYLRTGAFSAGTGIVIAAAPCRLHHIRLGNQSARPGKKIRMIIRIASQIRKGKAALATWNRVVPLGATPNTNGH